jgi:hypothetical protein
MAIEKIVMLFTDEKPGSRAAIGKIAHRRQVPAAEGVFVAPARGEAQFTNANV